jgi:hypothetical protein
MADDDSTATLPDTPRECLAEVRRCERQGELFRAYDLARQALEKFPDDVPLSYRAVLCLASTGATAQAFGLLDKLKLDRRAEAAISEPMGLQIATLRPRLMKDAALAASGEKRVALLTSAAEAYAAVYREAKAAGHAEAYYPGINGATLRLLAGDEAAAMALARDVIAELDNHAPERKEYYEVATEVEAQLILGDVAVAREGARGLRAQMRRETQTDYRGWAGTVRQLRLVVEAKGLVEAWGDALAPPRVIHYGGHIIAPPGKPGRFPADQETAVKEAIENLLAEDDVGFGYGSLAAGADILFAEALLARGARLHLVMPFDRDEFVEVSVRSAGEGWVERFEKCYHAAETMAGGAVHFATEDRYLDDDYLFGYCSQLAMGLALLRARHMSASVEQIVVWDGEPSAGPAGTAADIAIWQHAGLPRKVIPVGNGFQPAVSPPATPRGIKRQPHAMLFGDVHGFSKLRDDQIPPFIDRVLGCFARVVDRHRVDIRLANTWGDGLFLVFDDAGKAAGCALELQEVVGELDMVAHGLPADMGLRIGLHLGPAYSAPDPVLGKENFFGVHVSRAARIEPVTPEGSVYVTETMAAVLALHNSTEYDCELVGSTEAAKHYGALRMFLLRRAAQ